MIYVKLMAAHLSNCKNYEIPNSRNWIYYGWNFISKKWIKIETTDVTFRCGKNDTRNPSVCINFYARVGLLE